MSDPSPNLSADETHVLDTIARLGSRGAFQQLIAENNALIRSPILDNGRAIATARSAIYTALVRSWAAEQQQKLGYDKPFAVVALGGTGRAEMAPHSDNDFAFLFGGTCFCVSMGTGPRCSARFDFALTELEDGFVVEVGSPKGEELLSALSTREATEGETAEVDRIVGVATERMGRTLDTSDMPDLLVRYRTHPRWQDVAARCLACANCTNVCPTCFCHDVVDGVSLSGDVATRTRECASCFSAEYSWTAGEVVRDSRASRYRQWLTHKFATWIDQYGRSGCVGCRRCITWCPVGIDVTEEVAAIRVADGEVEVVAR